MSTVHLADLVCLDDVEAAARPVMERSVYEYVSGGAGDECTLRWNRERFQDIKLLTRTGRDLTGLDCSTTLFGEKMPTPILIAPTANHGLTHPEAELASIRGANAVGATFVLSTGTSVTVEDIMKEASVPVWFQLYTPKERSYQQALIERVAAAGVKMLCVTMDNPVNGTRNRELRAKLKFPAGFRRPHHDDMGEPRSSVTLDGVRPADLTWKDIEWFRSLVKIPIVVKGIMNPEDAELAIQTGVAGIVVSNHGGRELDGQPATIEVLPQIVAQVRGRVPVIVDGGIRRGSDVVKALALGASAVMVGRPLVYGLAVGGAEGVAHVMKLLRQELLVSMALLGRPTIASIDQSVIWKV